MINSLKIQNFQSHDDTNLEFHPGVNVIVGTTDSGKSAIIRALKWVITNRPLGEAFRSWWGGDTKVQLATDSGFIVERAKAKENTYRVWEEHPDGLNETFKAFKNEVPEEIAAHLNMDETNLQQQLDAPFLISSSPGEVAAYFNKIAHLDQIDTGLKAVQGQIRTLTSEITFTETQLQGLQAEALTYAYLDKVEVELEQLEADVKTRQNLYGSQATIKNSIVQLNILEQEMMSHRYTVSLESDVDHIMQLIESRNETITEKDQLEAGIVALETYEKQREAFLEKASHGSAVDKILVMMEKQATLLGQRDSANILLKEIRDSDALATEHTQEIVDMEALYKQHMPDVCPLCNQEIESTENI